MMGRLLRCCLILGLVAVLLYLLRGGVVPNHLLLRRVEQLETQNGLLHENLQSLAAAATPKGRTSQGPLEGEGEEGEEEEDIDSCEEIHLVLVVSGANTVRALVVLVKSILFHRLNNPLHLHFLSDPRSRESLSAIFTTWQLPAVGVSFYPLSRATDAVKWIPNTHYSGVYGLAKLTLASILPASLSAAIVLDTDLMLSADIGVLWGFAKRLRRAGKQLGLVENQSDWYLGNLWKAHHPWPAVGRGFNTGVAVLNLELMRARDWNGTWHVAATRSLATHYMAALADQDVINAAIHEDKGLVYVLPCVWNVQLSKNTLSDYCFRAAHHFKIVHWNSDAKLDVKNVHGPHFKNLYTMFEEYDSMLFRTHFSDCESPQAEGNGNEPGKNGNEPEQDGNDRNGNGPEQNGNDPDWNGNEPCADFRRERWIVRRVFPFYLRYSYESPRERQQHDVTLVAQMSMDRLHMLSALCEQWAGPLSIALYASDADLRVLLAHVHASPALRDHGAGGRLGLHVVAKAGALYPVNHLRNVALSYARTPYVYLSDIDFMPMPGLYYYTMEAVRVLLGADDAAGRRALIVPAFESLLFHRTDLPSNKSQLISMLDAGKLFTFRYHVWRQGHAPTNFQHWRGAGRPYRIRWEEDFEPYVVVSRNVTRYDERFVGFGWNKMSHAMELASQGYEWVVLPEGFMVHMPHAPSPDITSYRESKHYRDCTQVRKVEFRRELQLKYHHTKFNHRESTTLSLTIQQN